MTFKLCMKILEGIYDVLKLMNPSTQVKSFKNLSCHRAIKWIFSEFNVLLLNARNNGQYWQFRQLSKSKGSWSSQHLL